MRFATLFLAVFCLAVSRPACCAEKPPHELYDALNALRVDPTAVYTVKPTDNIALYRADAKLSFDAGKLAFLTAFDGHITGAVYSGRGHALATPRDLVEKQQLGRFLGEPLLDQNFNSAYLRFTDGSAEELLHQFQNASIPAQTDVELASRWDAFVAHQNPAHSLRILFEWLSRDPQSYFSATLDGASVGLFDLLFDKMRSEQFLIGQPHKLDTSTFYDVWASYKVPGVPPPAAAFRALNYSIDTTILPNNSLEATSTVRIHAETGTERVVVFQLSHSLEIQGITGENNRPLIYFQNDGMTEQERTIRGNDYVSVVLPDAPVRGQEFTLHLRYHGNVIEDAGNGVLFVGARESWYPHLGESSDFADYELLMRWPRRLRLVATGEKLEEHEDGDFRVGHWRTERPVAVAGFNLGDYASTSVTSASYSVDVYANHHLEDSLKNRLSGSDAPVSIPLTPLGVPGGADRMQLPFSAPPNPASALKELGKQLDASIHFYEIYSGPFPFHNLSVSQIPGSFAQGWPGLLYLSTYSYLSPDAQQRMGLSSANQEHYRELVPYHEVAHQWWGNVVGWNSYRDQWIDESIANYLCLLFADSQKNPDHTLRIWLERFREHLLTKAPGSDEPPSEVGALVLGSRLNSSKSPGAYDAVIYSKGAWVFHMLREMLRQPGAKNPDTRFMSLMRGISEKYAGRALTTEDLQREIEAVMTPAMDLEGDHSMDWFFDEWVRGTGIPHYRVEFTTHKTEKGLVIRGKLFQTGVPRSFISPVPLYASISGHSTYLGTVVTSGPETSFHFASAAGAPHKILIDPQMTLLSTTAP
jgi:Peptidase family M1 domain